MLGLTRSAKKAGITLSQASVESSERIDIRPFHLFSAPLFRRPGKIHIDNATTAEAQKKRNIDRTFMPVYR